MKCPQMPRCVGYDENADPIVDLGDCLEEECAWWDGKQCAILSIAKALGRYKG